MAGGGGLDRSVLFAGIFVCSVVLNMFVRGRMYRLTTEALEEHNDDSSDDYFIMLN